LDLDCAVNCVEDAGEFCKDAITGRVRNPPSMPPSELIDHGAAGGQRFHRRFFIAVH